MRPLVLAALAAAVLGGCDLLNGGCPDVDFSEKRFPAKTFRTAAPTPDTLTVAFVTDYNVRVFVRPDEGRTPYTSLEAEVVLGYDALVASGRPAAPTFETAARGDTLWVQPAFGLVREACSYHEDRLDVYVSGVVVPAGVRHVRFATVDVTRTRGLPFSVSDRALSSLRPTLRA